METKYLDNEISSLQAHSSRGDLPEHGTKVLEEFLQIKEILINSKKSQKELLLEFSRFWNKRWADFVEIEEFDIEEFLDNETPD